ncbi:MAG: TlpA family protein disulfide reductase [Bacteroidetes bacterium]|nr:TlpA family protein disulfide reductase [Bacteroidota bacterium]
MLAQLFMTVSLLWAPGVSQKDSLLEVGAEAPNFYLRMLDGSDFYSRDLYGETRSTPKARKDRDNVVLSFFATWCGPCRKEIPELQELSKKYPDVKFYLIDVAEDREKVENHLKTTPIELPILLDVYGKVAEKFKVKGEGNSLAVLPTLVMINKDGTIHFYKKGYEEGDEFKIEEQILKFAN